LGSSSTTLLPFFSALLVTKTIISDLIRTNWWGIWTSCSSSQSAQQGCLKSCHRLSYDTRWSQAGSSQLPRDRAKRLVLQIFLTVIYDLMDEILARSLISKGNSFCFQASESNKS
jgi:hypothetical protein